MIVMVKHRLLLWMVVGACALGTSISTHGATGVAKWQRVEIKLDSSASYTNPVQQAT